MMLIQLSNVEAKDLGVWGATFLIVEEDLQEVILKRAKEKTQGGNLKKLQQAQILKAKKRLEAPVSGFKAFKANFLEKIINKKMIEHGLCFDMELLVIANSYKKNSIGEFPLVWIDSIAESSIRKEKDKNFLEMLQSLSLLYQKYGKKTLRGDSFKTLISLLNVDDLNLILIRCPKSIYSRDFQILKKYSKITANQLYHLAQ